MALTLMRVLFDVWKLGIGMLVGVFGWVCWLMVRSMAAIDALDELRQAAVRENDSFLGVAAGFSEIFVGDGVGRIFCGGIFRNLGAVNELSKGIAFFRAQAAGSLIASAA